MKCTLFFRTAAALALSLTVPVLHAQSGGSDVYWRLDPSVKSCSMAIDRSLTQEQWHQFLSQGGAVLSFKALAPASTLGKMNYRIAIEYGSTPIDQHNPAWINTFVHPDEACPLGDAIVIPAFRASVGLADHMDVGGFVTYAPDANYGEAGGEFKYAFLPESDELPAVAARVSAAFLLGVRDFNVSLYGIDVLASKRFSFLTPYVGFRESLIIGTETTDKVNLDTEHVFLAQGYAGISVSYWALNLAAEYGVSTVNTFTVALGVNF